MDLLPELGFDTIDLPLGNLKTEDVEETLASLSGEQLLPSDCSFSIPSIVEYLSEPPSPAVPCVASHSDMPSLDVICSSLGIGDDSEMLTADIKPQSPLDVADYFPTPGMSTSSGDELDFDIDFPWSTPVKEELDYTETASSYHTPVCDPGTVTESHVPFALLSALSPPEMASMLPLSVRMSMLRLRLRGRGNRRSAKLTAIDHFYNQRSEQLEAQRYEHLTLQGRTPWQLKQTNQYFDMQHHALIDSVDAYVTQYEQSTTKKRKLVEAEEPSSKRLSQDLSLHNVKQELVDILATSPPTPQPQQPAHRSRPVGLTRHATVLMEEWYESHSEHPYPSPELITEMADTGDITKEQVKKWFSNRRMRQRKTKSWKEIRERRHLPADSVSDVFIRSETRY